MMVKLTEVVIVVERLTGKRFLLLNNFLNLISFM